MSRESEWENERVWECESVREWESVKVREWLLSIDMKTKVVQHVESEWIREWKSEREWECERVSERVFWFPAFVWHSDIFLNRKTHFKHHKTPWLFTFWPNESDGTKFSPCFYIWLGLSDTFAKSLLSENGYFIGFWHFWPNFRLIIHTPK